MKPTIAIAALLALALVACRQDDPNNIAIDEGNSLNGEIETLPPDEGNEATAAANANAPADVTTIPLRYQGRWGMVVADCEPGRSDAKGLITIGASTVIFYEAVATLKEQQPAIPEAFSGLFSFTGEGQTWEKAMTFTRTGDTLKRAEEAGTFTYTRCR